MYLTGFADEAARGVDGQIKATKQLGWHHIEARSIDCVNIVDLPDEKFEQILEKLNSADIKINCIGSTIANWSKQITDDFDITISDVKRAIPKTHKLNTKMIRIMSYAILKDKGSDEQMEQERFRRLREIKKMFDDAGIIPVHENCQNYGGMSYKHTLRLLENVPGLRLVFDTGNPILSEDYSRQKPYPKQSSWEFYSNIKESIAYIHIKDGKWDTNAQKAVYCCPGDGHGDIKRILKDLILKGYAGGISIEPHIATVFHEKLNNDNEDVMFNSYIEYGRRLGSIINDIKKEVSRAK